MKPNHIRTLKSDQIYTDNREGASDRNWKVREDIPENKSQRRKTLKFWVYSVKISTWTP